MFIDCSLFLPHSIQIRKQLGELMDHVDHESTWNLLDVTNKALFELQIQLNKYKQ